MGFGGRSQLEIEELIPENQRSERFAGEAPSVTKFLYKLWSAHKSTTQEAMPDQRRAEILGKLWSANMSATLNYDDLFEGYAKMVVRAGFAPEPQSIIFYGSGDANWIAEDQNRILLENERLKTQLISEQRAVLQARQHNRQLTAQNESLVDGVCILAKANKALQAALVARKPDRDSRT